MQAMAESFLQFESWMVLPKAAPTNLLINAIGIACLFATAVLLQVLS